MKSSIFRENLKKITFKTVAVASRNFLQTQFELCRLYKNCSNWVKLYQINNKSNWWNLSGFSSAWFSPKKMPLKKTFLLKVRSWNLDVRGHSQTTLTARGGSGVHEMSTLLNKYHKIYYVKLSTRGEGLGVKKAQKSVNIVCERPLTRKLKRLCDRQ